MDPSGAQMAAADGMGRVRPPKASDRATTAPGRVRHRAMENNARILRRVVVKLNQCQLDAVMASEGRPVILCKMI